MRMQRVKIFYSSASYAERKLLKKKGMTPELPIYVVRHLYCLKSQIFQVRKNGCLKSLGMLDLKFYFILNTTMS